MLAINLEGQIEAGVDGIDEGDLGESEIADDDDAPQSEVGDDAASEADEDVLLPSGLEESELKTATEVDLSKLDISAAQARKIAPLLCANEALTTIRCEGGHPRAPSLSPSASTLARPSLSQPLSHTLSLKLALTLTRWRAERGRPARRGRARVGLGGVP